MNFLGVCWLPLGSPGEPEGSHRKREAGAQLRVRAGLLGRNPALTCVPMRCVLGFPTVPRGTAGKPAETRDWCTSAGQRRASLQEPCADLLGSPPFQGEREGTQRKRETCAQVQVSAGLLCRNPALTCASDKLIFDLLY